MDKDFSVEWSWLKEQLLRKPLKSFLPVGDTWQHWANKFADMVTDRVRFQICFEQGPLSQLPYKKFGQEVGETLSIDPFTHEEQWKTYDPFTRVKAVQGHSQGEQEIDLSHQANTIEIDHKDFTYAY